MTVGSDGFDEGKAISKVGYSHEQMINLILGEPGITQTEIARRLGYTRGWISRIIASDAFQARLDERKQQLLDPEIAKSLQERLEGLGHQALEAVTRKLDATDSAAYALEALGIAAKGLGFLNGQGPRR